MRRGEIPRIWVSQARDLLIYGRKERGIEARLYEIREEGRGEGRRRHAANISFSRIADHGSPYVYERQRRGNVRVASLENTTDTPRDSRFLSGATDAEASRRLSRRRSQSVSRRDRRSNEATSAELSEATAELSGRRSPKFGETESISLA